MRLTFVAVVLAALTAAAAQDSFRRFLKNGSSVADPALAYLLSFAPASGLGMGTECAGTVPTGAQGETLTFTRASAASCTKADGTVVILTSGQPAVQPQPYLGSGPLGIISEGAASNVLLRSEELENAAWISTAAVTADATVSPDGAQDADLLTDSSAVAIQTSCQTYSTTAARFRFASVYLKAGTASSATISITGTGSSAGDKTCSIGDVATGICKQLANGWSRCGCSPGAAFAGTLTAVTVCIGVGDEVADQGTLSVWGAQSEGSHSFALLGQNHSSYIRTTSAFVTRNAAFSQLAIPAGLTNTQGCIVASTYQVTYDGEGFISSRSVSSMPTTSKMYFATASSVCSDDESSPVTCRTGLSATVNRLFRFMMTWTTTGSALTATADGTTTTGTYDGTVVGATIDLGARGSASTTQYLDGWLTDFQAHNTTTGCTP